MESNFRVVAAVDEIRKKDHMKHSCTQNHQTVNFKVLLIHGKSWLTW